MQGCEQTRGVTEYMFVGEAESLRCGKPSYITKDLLEIFHLRQLAELGERSVGNSFPEFWCCGVKSA